MASIGWSPKRIEHEISHSHYDDGRSKGYVGHVNPMDFLHATTRDDAHLKTIFDEAGNLNFKKLTKETQSPFLEFEDGKIFGHEGRHRMAALAKNGYTKVPVMVKPYWSSGKNLAPVDQVNFEPQFEGRNPVTINNLIPLNKNYKNQIDDMMAEHPEHFQDGGPITAYHGTPHDFEQFDTSKIGTGEGAQAYGHGLYFAEHEPTAQYYRDTLAHRGQIDLEHEANKLNMPMSREAMIEVRRHASGNYDPNEAAKHMHWSSVEARQYPQEKLANLIDIYRKAKQGNMYEVAIHAHPDHMLDWDKPLSEQSEHVQNAIKNIASNSEIDPFEHLALAASIGKHPRSQEYSPKGKDLYNDLEEVMGSINWPDNANLDTRNQYRKSAAERVSQHLSDHGIHGIKYLDANSRGASGQPTHNYVVFDHNRVKVKRKYEQGGRVAYKKGGKVEGSIWHEDDIDTSYLGNLLRGLKSIPETAYNYLANTSYNQMGSDALDLGKNVYHDVTEHPIENLLGALPVVGSGMAAYDAYKLNDRIKQAYASGNHEDAQKLERALALSSLGAIPIFGELSSFGSSVARMAEEAALHGAAETGSRAVANLVPRDAYQVAENIASNKINQALDLAKKHMFSAVSDERITTPNIGGDRSGDVEGYARSGFKKMTEEQKMLQNIDEPWLESVQKGLANQKKYGFKKGGIAKTTQIIHNSPIVGHALGKVSAALPALDLPLMAAKAGRRY